MVMALAFFAGFVACLVFVVCAVRYFGNRDFEHRRKVTARKAKIAEQHRQNLELVKSIS